MELITFTNDNSNLKYAIFVKHTSANPKAIKKYYLDPLVKLGMNLDEIALVSFTSDTPKFKAVTTKEQLIKSAKMLEKWKIKNILIPNGDLYKFTTGVAKTSECFGEPRPGKLDGFEDKRIVLSIDYNALIYNESLRLKMDNSLEVFYKDCTNVFKITKSIIHHRETPVTAAEIKTTLDELSQYDTLGCDIETESLRFEKARIITIAFSWNQHEGVVFSLDTAEEEDIKYLLFMFFFEYGGILKFHGALFDVKVIIYQLFMQDSLDLDGLRIGLETFRSNVEDSMLVTYLATNSTQENPLGLKENAFEFAGNYGIEFKKEGDVHNYPREEVLEYNLKDALCIWYVESKHYPTMVRDKQEEVYRTMFLPSIMPLLYMMLIGMPMNMKKVHKASEKLDGILGQITEDLAKSPHVIDAVAKLKEARRQEDNAARLGKAKNPDKIKIKTIDEIPDKPFNPNSPDQKAFLLYEVLELPVINFTKTKKPSSDGKTLKALFHAADDPEIKELLSLLIDHAAAAIISSTFLKTFIEYAFTREDGSVWLNGNLKLGGTQGGRLASSDPNMQNIPSNSKYGKMIKECFEAPEGFLFGGADFSSLEDRINAILTGDKNKVKVYTDGYDGHCLRAHSYFGNQMPDITQAIESDTCYKANVGGTNIWFKATDTIKHKNSVYTGDEFYAAFTSGRL